MKKNTPQILKGFRDYLPQEQIARRKILEKISIVFERFGFVPIDTPALEPLELLKGKIGEEEKLIYKFKDLGSRDVALRYDLTVPLGRVMGLNQDLPKPFKRYQAGNVWRAENTQRGRFREFTQVDADIVGSSSIIADAEVIATIKSAYQALEVGDVVLKINDRRLINLALDELAIPKSKHVAFMRWLDKLDKIGEKKVIDGLKSDGIKPETFKAYEDILKSKEPEFFKDLFSMLKDLGVEDIKFDPFLVRGLDYYTGTIFEFVLKSNTEFGSIGGGGRYDGLIGSISGADMPAVGGSIGLDRMFAALKEAGLIAPQTAAEVIVLNLDAELVGDYLRIATNLRDSGLDCEVFYEPSKLDKQFRYAEAKNIKVAVVYGKDEVKLGKAGLKDLEKKSQVLVDLENLATEIKSMLW
jgi:histidyl-tRNA synthetase